jgi:prepilin-type N-terminal cleavage/methylation domain-containing protein
VRQRLAAEQGFTLIELLVGMVILVVGIFGLVASVDSSRKLGDTTEHEAVAAQVADRELDTATALQFNAVALTGRPVASGTAGDDVSRWNAVYPTVVPAVTGGNNCSTSINEALANDETSAGTSGSGIGCLVVCPPSATANTVGCTDNTATVKGRIPPIGTVSVPAGSGTLVRLKVYRYVTWVNDRACGTDCPSPCTSGCASGGTPTSTWRGDYKRITIAVQVVTRATATSGTPGTAFGTGPKKPIVVSALKRDPTLGKGNGKGDNAGCGKILVC